jgi:hypothetical protein
MRAGLRGGRGSRGSRGSRGGRTGGLGATQEEVGSEVEVQDCENGYVGERSLLPNVKALNRILRHTLAHQNLPFTRDGYAGSLLVLL